MSRPEPPPDILKVNDCEPATKCSLLDEFNVIQAAIDGAPKAASDTKRVEGVVVTVTYHGALRVSR